MKNILPISVGFQAVALVAFMVSQSLAGALTFTVATAFVAFLSFLERSRADEAEQMKRMMGELGQRIVGLEMAIGMGR